MKHGARFFRMQQRRRSLGGRRAAVAVAIVTSAVALAGPAWADVKASIACRGAIAKGLSGVASTGFKTSDACHKAADKAVMGGGACNNTANPAFDTGGKYAQAKTKSAATISGKCVAGDPVLANYDGQNPESTVTTFIDEVVGGDSFGIVGIKDLGGAKAKIKCLQTIGKSRTGIIKEILKTSTNCQAGKDKTATTFGSLDPACVGTPVKSGPKATTQISGACTGLTAADVGSCDPLPTCVVSQATSDAQDIAKAIYQKVTPTVCGNGTIESGEQCDDGANNGTSGDPCNIKCELLTNTCSVSTLVNPADFIGGTRMITVSLSVPGGSQLAGVQVGFDYPQLEASIPGTGTSSVVQGAFQVLATPPASGFISLANDTDTEAQILISSGENFIGSGPLVAATLNNCVSLSQNICNRNQNVFGCCPEASVVACNANPDDHNACFCGFKGFGAGGVVSETDCSAAPHGACTAGVCTSIPDAPAGSCCTSTKICTSGERNGLACTTDDTNATTGCGPSATCPSCCVANSNCPAASKCSLSSPNPGKACTAAAEAKNCSGAALDAATCTSTTDECSFLGDQANGTFGCFSIFNPLGSSIGNFPPVLTGRATPAGACPTNNTCTDQTQLTAASCTVTSPTDALGQIVQGVTCSVVVTEAP